MRSTHAGPVVRHRVFRVPDREGSLWLGARHRPDAVDTPSPGPFFVEADGLAGISIGRHSNAGPSVPRRGARRAVPRTRGPKETYPISAASPGSVASAGPSLGKMPDATGAPRCSSSPHAGLTGSTEDSHPDLGPRRRSFRRPRPAGSETIPTRCGSASSTAGVVSWLDGRWMDEGRVKASRAGAARSSRTRTARCGRARRTGCCAYRSPAICRAAAPATHGRAIRHSGTGSAGRRHVFDAGGSLYSWLGPSSHPRGSTTQPRRFVREPGVDVGRLQPRYGRHRFGLDRAGRAVYLNCGRKRRHASASRTAVGRDSDVLRAWARRSSASLFPEPTGSRGCNSATTSSCASTRAAVPRRAFPRSSAECTTTRGQPLFGGAGAAARAKVLGAAATACASSSRRRASSTNGHRVSVAAGRPRRRLVAVDARGAARLHRISGFGDYRFRVRARNVTGQCQRGGRLRLHDPAAVVSHVVGVRAATCSLAALLLGRVDRAAAPPRRRARSASGRRSPKRGCAPKRPKRSRGRRARARERRAAQRDRPRDHRVARLRHDLRQALRTRQPARRRRRVRRRPLPSRAPGDRVPPRDREGQALHAVHARHHATAISCRCGASSTASRSSSTTCRRSTAATSAPTTRRASSSKTARCRSSRSRSSTCRCSRRTACSASSPSRASRRTPTPSITST